MMERQDTRVLIVDDVSRNLQVLGATLSKNGYRIIAAQNGRQALESVQEIRPDLILLDVMMPEMDGFETCKRLKADPETRDIPIIFLTAKTEIEDVVQGFDLGAVDYATKPLNPKELLARVRTHLTLRKTQEALEQRVQEIATMKREQEAFLRHEMNNRLTPICGYAEILKMEPDRLEEDQLDRVSRIVEAARDMSTLIDSLKKLQDIEAGQATLYTQPVELADLVPHVVTTVKMSFGDTVRMNIHNHMTDGTIKADANLLRGVFENLIKNGIEHVRDLEDEDQRCVTVRMDHEDGYAVVRINNRGEPVPPERLATFFEKFNTDKKKKQGGTGLGTTYAYLVTRGHGGEISVTSDETEGTTVTVKLPQL